MRPGRYRFTTDEDLELSTRADWLGHHRLVEVTLRNKRDETVSAWAVTVSAPGTLSGVYAAECRMVPPSSLRVRGDHRTRHIPPGGSVTFGLLFE